MFVFYVFVYLAHTLDGSCLLGLLWVRGVLNVWLIKPSLVFLFDGVALLPCISPTYCDWLWLTLLGRNTFKSQRHVKIMIILMHSWAQSTAYHVSFISTSMRWKNIRECASAEDFASSSHMSEFIVVDQQICISSQQMKSLFLESSLDMSSF